MSRFFAWLLQSTLAASGLIILLALARKLLGSRIPPRWRYALWLLAALCLLFPARVTLPMAAQPSVTTDYARRVDAAVSRVMAVPHPMTLSEASTPPSDGTPGEFTPQPSPITLGDIIFWAWVSGDLLAFAYIAAVNIRFQRRVRSAMPFPAGQVVCDALRRSMGMRRRVPVLATRGVYTPCMAAFPLRILLPSDTRPDAPSLRHVLLHELCHIRQHDLAAAWVRTAALALHWFNPIVWWAARASRQDAELSCDAMALEQLSSGEATDYGMTLLRMARSVGESRALAATGFITRGSGIRERVRLISQQPRKRIAAIIATLFLAMMLAACSLAGHMAAMGVAENVGQEPSHTPEIVSAATPSVPTPTADQQVTLEPEPTPAPSAADLSSPTTQALSAKPVDLRYFVSESLMSNPYISKSKMVDTGAADLTANDRYEAALAAWRDGKRPAKPPPASPAQSGFAVIPVRPEAYGVNALAILPRRALTDEEMLQLVDALGGKELEDLTDWQVMVAGQHNETNREWTRGERERYVLSLRDAFIYEKRAPSFTLTEAPIPNDIAYVTLNPQYEKGLDEMWLFPAYEMTDEQILAFIAYGFQNTPEEYYRPGAEDMSKEHAADQARAWVSKTFGVDSTAPGESRMSFSGAAWPAWVLDLRPERGIEDYLLTVDSRTGQLLEALRLPKYVPVEQADGSSLMTPVDGTPMETQYDPKSQEVSDAAAAFAGNYLADDGVSIAKVTPSGDRVDMNMGPCSDVSVTLSDDTQYVVSVALSDLRVAKVVREDFRLR